MDVRGFRRPRPRTQFLPPAPSTRREVRRTHTKRYSLWRRCYGGAAAVLRRCCGGAAAVLRRCLRGVGVQAAAQACRVALESSTRAEAFWLCLLTRAMRRSRWRGGMPARRRVACSSEALASKSVPREGSEGE